MRCADCKFWHRSSSAEPSTCRRQPPHVFVNRGTAPNGAEILQRTTAWPVATPNDWCGEFTPRLAVAN